MSDPGQADSSGTSAALDRLEQAVSMLEAAADAHANDRDGAGPQSDAARAEADALRAVQQLLSDRLDAAIARLRAGVEG